MKIQNLLKSTLSKYKDKTFTIFIMLCIICVSIFSLIQKDKTFSSVENKLLTQYKKVSISNILDKSYMNNLENYFSDQFPCRNDLMSLNTYIKKYVLFENNINNVYIGNNGYLFNYYNSNDFDMEQIEKNVNSLNTFTKKYNSRIYLIPSSFEILKDELPIINNNINPNEYLKNIENIDYVDNILLNNQNEYIFYKTDHHWTTYGAFILYKEEFNKNATYNSTIVSTNFLGTIHSRLNIKNEFDKIESPIINENLVVKFDYEKGNKPLYYNSYLKTKDQYAYFLDGNHAFVEITNPTVSNGKILVIKDSFANCFIPFLTNDYNEIDVVDLRYLNMPISKIIGNNEYDEIIVLYNKVNFMTDKHIYKLAN